MRNRKRIATAMLTAVTAIFTAALGVSACCEETPATDIVDGGEFILGSATELNDFDPYSSITADVRSVNFNIFEGLVKVQPNGDFTPAIASDYEVSEDGTVYTFTLREGVKFHNGEDVTEDDVLYSVRCHSRRIW